MVQKVERARGPAVSWPFEDGWCPGERFKWIRVGHESRTKRPEESLQITRSQDTSFHWRMPPRKYTPVKADILQITYLLFSTAGPFGKRSRFGGHFRPGKVELESNVKIRKKKHDSKKNIYLGQILYFSWRLVGILFLL